MTGDCTGLASRACTAQSAGLLRQLACKSWQQAGNRPGMLLAAPSSINLRGATVQHRPPTRPNPDTTDACSTANSLSRHLCASRYLPGARMGRFETARLHCGEINTHAWGTRIRCRCCRVHSWGMTVVVGRAHNKETNTHAWGTRIWYRCCRVHSWGTAVALIGAPDEQTGCSSKRSAHSLRKWALVWHPVPPAWTLPSGGGTAEACGVGAHAAGQGRKGGQPARLGSGATKPTQAHFGQNQKCLLGHPM